MFVCQTCLQGVVGKNVDGHMHAQHQLPHLKIHQKKELNWIYETYQVVMDASHLTHPTGVIAPIEGIKLGNKGFYCKQCFYGYADKKSLARHWLVNHPELGQFNAQEQSGIAICQSFGTGPDFHSFPVDTALTNSSSSTLFEAFLKTEKDLHILQLIIPPPSTPTDVPPLLQTTQWHTHLKDYIDTRDKVFSLLALIHPPSTKSAPYLLTLRKTVVAYQKTIRDQSHNAIFLIRKVLMQCPLYVSAPIE